MNLASSIWNNWKSNNSLRLVKLLERWKYRLTTRSLRFSKTKLEFKPLRTRANPVANTNLQEASSWTRKVWYWQTWKCYDQLKRCPPPFQFSTCMKLCPSISSDNIMMRCWFPISTCTTTKRRPLDVIFVEGANPTLYRVHVQQG